MIIEIGILVAFAAALVLVWEDLTRLIEREELDASSDHRVDQSAGTQPPPCEGLTAVPADLVLVTEHDVEFPFDTALWPHDELLLTLDEINAL